MDAWLFHRSGSLACVTIAAMLLILSGCTESPGPRPSSSRGSDTRSTETTTHPKPPRPDPG